jgi:uncharacterized protein YukE
MYEVFKRVTNKEGQVWEDESDESYEEGYNDGWNEAIEKIESELDDMAWNVGRMKK